jgi:hypothetical protein
MNYSNPLGGLANPTDFAASPFLQAQQAYLKNDMAMPLIQAQQKMSLMEGLQNAQKISEFMSPEQRGVRSAEAQDKIKGFAHKEALRPLEIGKAQADIASTNQQTSERAKKLEILLRDDAAKPAREMYTMIGAQANEIAKLPPQAQAMAWDQMVRQIEQATGQKLPDQLRQFSSNALTNGQIAYQATRNSPQNTFTAEQADLDRKNRVTTANISASASRHATDSADRRARDTEKNTNPQQRLVALAKVINDPKKPQEERDGARQEYTAFRRSMIMSSPVVREQLNNMMIFPNPATGKPFTPQEQEQAILGIIQMQERQDPLMQGAPVPNPEPSRGAAGRIRLDNNGNIVR